MSSCHLPALGYMCNRVRDPRLFSCSGKMLGRAVAAVIAEALHLVQGKPAFGIQVADQ